MSGIALPYLRPDQLAIARHPAKQKVIVCGRRWGKSVLGGVITGNTIRQHGAAAWVVPEYKNSRPLWRWAQRTFTNNPDFRINRGERTIETARGGFFGVYSADNIDSIRSEAFDVVVIDEGARVSEEAVTDAIIPTLADRDGDLIVITTPKGKNWVWQWYQRGLAGDGYIQSWQAPTYDNPIANIRLAYERAREKLTERTFRQEWDAQFLDDGGEVFRYVREAAVAEPQDTAIYDLTPFGSTAHDYVIGADWGKHNDFTAFAVIDLNTRQCVHMDRSNLVDYAVQRGRLGALALRFGNPTIIAESNAMGEPIIEQLQRDGLTVIPFNTTNATKAVIIEALALAFERREIGIIADDILINELESYGQERLPSGLMRYGAPVGMHDDTVMALALAWSGAGFDIGI